MDFSFGERVTNTTPVTKRLRGSTLRAVGASSAPVTPTQEREAARFAVGLKRMIHALRANSD